MKSFNYRVESYDVHPNGNIKMSSLMRILQKIAGDDLDNCNMSHGRLYSFNVAFVLTKITIQLFDTVKLYDDLVVETYPRPVKGAAFVRDFIIRKNQTEVVKASSTWCIIDFAERKILRPNALDNIGTIPTTDECRFSLPFIRRIIKLENTSRTDVRKVGYSNLDMNSHLNNTYYADFIFDAISQPWDKPINDMFFEINFKNEAKLNETLDIFTTNNNNNEIDFIAIKQSDSKPCFTAYINFNASKL